MDALRQDIRFAIRSFARRPAFAVSAILSLAIGIAAIAASRRGREVAIRMALGVAPLRQDVN